ncbi:MAG TPA: DUF417 family protein [Sphingomicrobium sp.]|nr:DUF417 family protein [Sphingomicrobium sp.]
MANSEISAPKRIERIGRAAALAGIIIPLLLIGGLKFTAAEVEALKPLIGNTPWLRWLYLLGHEQASYLLGIIEIAAAASLIASPWSRKAAIIGAGFAVVTFLVTSTLLLLPMAWDPTIGFPALGPLGQFLIKDIALLGVALTYLGEKLGEPTAEA